MSKNWKRERVDRFNAKNRPVDDRAISILDVTNPSESQIKTRIPYEDIDYLQCNVVDGLLLLASGLNSSQAAQILTERYDREYDSRYIRNLKCRYPKEFGKMLVFYREIFLNQQIQSLEQSTVQLVTRGLERLHEKFKDGEYTINDHKNLVSTLKSFAEIRRVKEEDPHSNGMDREEYKKLEDNMRKMLGK